MDKVKELVVTVSLPAGDVVKIAELKSGGQRRELSEQEFAELAAHGEEEGLAAALEEAYAAGAEDSNEGEEVEAAGEFFGTRRRVCVCATLCAGSFLHAR